MIITYSQRQQVLACMRIYPNEDISRVFNLPQLYMRSISLDYQDLSGKQKDKVYREVKNNTAFLQHVKLLGKMKEERELKQFYEDDVVMACLDKININNS